MTTLCQSMVTIANNRCPSLLHKAEFLKLTFVKAFTNFAKCRAIYDSGKALCDDDISELGMYTHSIKYHCILSCFTHVHRGADRQVYGAVQGLLSCCHCHPQAAHDGGSYSALPQKVESRPWVSWGARGRVNSCPV